MPVKFFICMLLRPTDAVLIASCRVSWNLKRPCRAVRTDLPHFPARVVVTPADAPHRFRGVERREETADDQVHADHGPSAAALRPPASASRPPHRRRDHRHGPRRTSLHGAWLAGCGADGRGLSGCVGPHGAGAPTGGLEAAPARPEAHDAAPARAGRATNLRVSSHRRAPAGRTRQDADPASRGSGPSVCAVADPLAVPARVTESVPCLAPAAARVCARRSVVLPPHITVSTDTPRGPGDPGHGHLARLSARPYGHARGSRPAARHGLGLALHLVPPRTAARLAPPPPPRASRETEDRASHDASQRDVAH